MLVRTLRPCEIAGRTARAGLPFDLPAQQAEAMIEAGDAVAIASTADGVDAPPAPAPAPPADEE